MSIFSPLLDPISSCHLIAAVMKSSDDACSQLTQSFDKLREFVSHRERELQQLVKDECNCKLKQLDILESQVNALNRCAESQMHQVSDLLKHQPISKHLTHTKNPSHSLLESRTLKRKFDESEVIEIGDSDASSPTAIQSPSFQSSTKLTTSRLLAVEAVQIGEFIQNANKPNRLHESLCSQARSVGTWNIRRLLGGSTKILLTAMHTIDNASEFVNTIGGVRCESSSFSFDHVFPLTIDICRWDGDVVYLSWSDCNVIGDRVPKYFVFIDVRDTKLLVHQGRDRQLRITGLDLQSHYNLTIGADYYWVEDKDALSNDHPVDVIHETVVKTRLAPKRVPLDHRMPS
jgi:hypothetical protein